MFISEKNKKKQLFILIGYIAITAFIALFGAVYEQFSHNAHTPYMWFAWVWVLGFGVIPHLVLCFVPLKNVPGIIPGCIYNFGVAMITCRSLFMGVTLIANQPDDKWNYTYLAVSILFLAMGFILSTIFVVFDILNRRQKKEL